MRNFFKNLILCQNYVKNLEGTSNDMSWVMNELTNLLQSGLLFEKSEPYKFICQHYSMGSSELAKLWVAEGHEPKSSNTFRCQISTLSKTLYQMFGEDVFEAFYQINKKELARIHFELKALLMRDVCFNDIFLEGVSDICKADKIFSMQNIRMQDCIEEINLLKGFTTSNMEKLLGEKDAEKLYYIKSILNMPLVNSSTKEINIEKVNLLGMLGLLDASNKNKK